jgi:hypothetical protein
MKPYMPWYFKVWFVFCGCLALGALIVALHFISKFW